MKKIKINIDILKIIVSSLLFILSFFSGDYALVVLLLSYGIISYKIYIHAFQNILKGSIFDENLLMILATIGAFCIGKNDEAVLVILLFQIGEYLSDLAVANSKKSITELMDLRSDTVHIEINGILQKVEAKTLSIGDTFVVRVGERIALDGEIIQGKSFVDTAALTGESVPRSCTTGDKVLSGFVNKESVLTVRATKRFEQSAASRIIELLETSGEKKTDTEKFITKFSKIYTPIVVGCAFLLAFVPPLLGYSFDEWLYRALVFLVISCPCALVISVPLGFFCGIGRASKEGIIVKGSNELDRLSTIQTVAFDKTGTITEGVFEVSEIGAEDEDDDGLLELAAYLEHDSNHPIAKSILKKYGKELHANRTSEYREIPGGGLSVQIDGILYYIGNYSLMEQYGIVCSEKESLGLTLYLARNKKYLGYLVIADKIKNESYSIMNDLSKEGITKTVLISGDHRKIVRKIGEAIGVDDYYAEMLPEDKANKIEELKKNAVVAFVGDGLNDAPVIKLADVGVAMGGMGSDATIEAADVVIMRDDISKVVEMIQISKRSKRIITFNIAFALLTKFIVLFLGIFGFASIWSAVFADVGVTLLSILNALRIMIVKIK